MGKEKLCRKREKKIDILTNKLSAAGNFVGKNPRERSLRPYCCILNLKTETMTLVKFNSPLSRSIDSLIKDFFNDTTPSYSKLMREDALHFPPVNISEHDNSFSLEFSVPGFEKTDFSISMDGRILSISAEHKTESENTTAKTLRREFGIRSFKRSFTLDEKIDAENIAAGYEKGILTVELPKKSEEVKKQKAIEVK